MWAWIKAERRQRRWTQEELSQRSGVPVRVIRAGEQGQRGTPTVDTLTKLAAAFEIPVGTLLALAGSAPVAAGPYLDALRDLGVPEDRIAKLLQVAGDLTAADWEWLIATAEQRGRQNDHRTPARPDPPAPLTQKILI